MDGWRLNEQDPGHEPDHSLREVDVFAASPSDKIAIRGQSGPRTHGSGNDLMRHLLCAANESARSRHKLTRDAEIAFAELAGWMQRSKDWEGALRDATHDDGEADGGAPCLHSPASMLAILVLSYPDPKFIRLFGRLQIQWMMELRNQLAISD